MPLVAGRIQSRSKSGLTALLLALGAAFFCQPLIAAKREFYFRPVEGTPALIQRSVQALAQDPQGFIWVGTQGGLQRFDGHGFYAPRGSSGKDVSSIDGFVNALAVDARGVLWVGGNSRFLSSVDTLTGEIRSTETRDDPMRDRVLAVQPGIDGSVWVGTAAGVERYRPADGQRTEVLRFGAPSGSRRRDRQYSVDLALDGLGRLYVAARGGLYRIDPDSSRSQRLSDLDGLQALHKAPNGRLWVGGEGGLWQITDDDRLEMALNEAGRPFPDIRRIAGGSAGRLWMALTQGGLIRFEPATGLGVSFEPRDNLPGSLHDRRVADLLVDSSDLLWVGGESFGLATSPVEGAHFELLLEPLEPGVSPARNNVRALLQTDDRHVWVGTSGGSLKHMELEDGSSREYIAAIQTAAGGRTRADAPIRILDLETSLTGTIWVASDAGLFDLTPALDVARLQPLPELPGDGDSAASPTARVMLRDANGMLWIGSDIGGVFALDEKTGQWRRFAGELDDEYGLGNSPVLSLSEDRSGRLWVGSMDGLYLLDPASDRIEHRFHRSDDPQSLSNNLIRAVAQTRDGRIWVASHGGLDLVIEDNADSGFRFERVGAAHGLTGATVYGILEDRESMLWLSTNDGLVRFDPSSGESRRFGISDGLQHPEFNGGAEIQLADGRLAMAGVRGINIFDPGQIAPSTFSPPLVLTSLRVGSDGEEQRFLGDLKELALPQSAQVFRLRFASLDFADPRQNRIQYRLDGFDDGWLDAGDAREATYTNLDQGAYVLRARGSNRDGVWSERELRLPLRVVPVWWNSPSARLGYLACTALIGLLWLYRHRRRRRQERDLLARLEEREQRLKLALWGSGDEFWDWDILANKVHRVGADQLLGNAEEEDLSTDEWRTRAVHPDDLGRVQALLQAHITGQTMAFESEHRVRDSRDRWIWVRSRGKVVERDSKNNALRIAGTARDITQSRYAERERRVASEVLRSMTEAVAVVDLAFCFVSVNPAFTRITGYSQSEVLGMSSNLLDSTQQQIGFYQQLRDSVERVGHWKGEIWQRRKSGEEFLGWIELSEVRDSVGERTHFVAVVTDITDQKRAELELRYLANYDPLTGLPNRTLLTERLERALVRARRGASKVAVLFLDLDRFKDINDSLGHSAGDRILRAVAARLQETVRDVDTVARLGGDEFTVVLEDLTDAEAAERMASRICDAFAIPLEIEGRAESIISPSIGVALYPDHATSPTDLLKFADTAMYQAKDRGRNTWQVYTEAMDAETRRRASMMAALRKALDRGEFSLLFQPKLSLSDGRITGVEALLRWHSDELGPVSPATFIPLAEETGLILPIGEWVLREAVMTLARWRQSGLNDLVMAINASVLQLLRGNLPAHVAAVLEECGVPANRIEIEVTETMVMANAEQAIRAMRELKGLGVSLAIDDFGTGYSSLIYLKRLPIDTLKIDKAFVGDLTTDPDDEAITATIITMAHSLGLNVVAEGAEAWEQVHYLREQGCDEIQGYWLSWPLDEQRCVEFIRQWSPEQFGAAETR